MTIEKRFAATGLVLLTLGVYVFLVGGIPSMIYPDFKWVWVSMTIPFGVVLLFVVWGIVTGVMGFFWWLFTGDNIMYDIWDIPGNVLSVITDWLREETR